MRTFLLLALLGCLALTATPHAWAKSSGSAPFTVPNGPKEYKNCVKTINDAYKHRIDKAAHLTGDVTKVPKPSKMGCFGSILKGFSMSWPTIDLGSILKDLTNKACHAMTSAINGQVSQVGGRVELPGGLGQVSVLPSSTSGVNGSGHDVSGSVGGTIWNHADKTIPGYGGP